MMVCPNGPVPQAPISPFLISSCPLKSRRRTKSAQHQTMALCLAHRRSPSLLPPPASTRPYRSICWNPRISNSEPQAINRDSNLPAALRRIFPKLSPPAYRPLPWSSPSSRKAPHGQCSRTHTHRPLVSFACICLDCSPPPHGMNPVRSFDSQSKVQVDFYGVLFVEPDFFTAFLISFFTSLAVASAMGWAGPWTISSPLPSFQGPVKSLSPSSFSPVESL